MKKTKTNRGFAIYVFSDIYGTKCSIQKSSLAERDAIWIGVDDPEPKIMACNAKGAGIETQEATGWISYPIPEQVLITTRMHLDRKQAKKLLPILQKFVDTGEI